MRVEMALSERSESKDPEPVEGSKGRRVCRQCREMSEQRMAWFYILRLRSGGLYVGVTENLQQRYSDHLAGAACRTTFLDPPIGLVFSEEYGTFSDARKREAQVKRWSRAKKEALISGDLQGLKSLARSREKR